MYNAEEVYVHRTAGYSPVVMTFQQYLWWDLNDYLKEESAWWWNRFTRAQFKDRAKILCHRGRWQLYVYWKEVKAPKEEPLDVVRLCHSVSVSSETPPVSRS